MEDGQTSNLNYNILYCIYLPTSLYYSLIVANDYFSNLIFFLTLLTLTSVFKRHQRKLLFMQSFITLADLVAKVLIIFEVFHGYESAVLDQRILKNIFLLSEESLDLSVFVYVGTLVLSWILPFTYNGKEKASSQTAEYYQFLRSISNLLDFITPLLIYTLGFTKLSSKSFREWIQDFGPQLHLSNFDMFQQVSWSLVTALFLILHKKKQYLRKFLTIMILILIIRDHHVKIYFPEISLYNLKPIYISAIKLSIILFFRIHNQTSHLSESDYSEEDDLQSSRMSSYKRFTVKRKMSLKADRNHLLIVFLVICTTVTMVLTNGLGNIIVILGIFINLPNYQEHSFRLCIGLGITASFLLQPNQFIYFIFLYVARYISTGDYVFDRKNWWIFIELGRAIILLSKVSVLNFLIGLFQSQFLVVFTIMFRTVCSFFKFILVFMGTEDNYEYYVEYFVPSSIITDILLWIHLIFLKMYNPSSTVKFQGTDITNIFKEYSVINYIQKGLKILKIFHWFAYIAISLMILNSQPCLFTLMRIIPLLLAFIVGIFESHRSQWSQRIWSWNFYTAFSIACVKYFYLLSKYDNLSPWLITILEPLQDHHQFIGLSPPDHTYLWITFGPDFLVIVINAIVLFLFKIQLSEVNYNLQKQRILQEVHIEARLLPIEQQDQKQKNIHYLYKNYIKSIEFKFKETSTFRSFLTDFILDICFSCYLIVFYLLPHEKYSIATSPYFILFYIGYFKQNGKHNLDHLFQYLIFISSIDLLYLYVCYFLAMIYGTDKSYSLAMILSKYLGLVISVIFNEINQALNKFYAENKIIKKNQYSYLVFKILAPMIPNELMKKEVLILYIHLFKVLTLAFFLTALIYGDIQIKIMELGGILLFGILMIGESNTKNLYKSQWIYCILASILASLWQGYYYTFLGLVFVRVYYMLIEEFNLITFIQKYGISNKTSNDEMKKRVEEVQYKYGSENRLQAISEVKSIREKQSYMSFGEDQINWREQNAYVTVVWILPILCIIVTILGIIFYQSGIVGLSLFTICITGLLYSLMYFEQWSITSIFTQRVMLAIAVLVLYSILDHLYLQFFTNSNYSFSNSLGIFFIIVGLLGYFELWRYKHSKISSKDYEYSYLIDFSAKRSQQAINYWKKKCEMVSELGSQIHNEKKMSSLRKLFLNKENLGMKVEHLSQELKEKTSHRRSRFQNLQKIQGLEEEKNMFKKQEFEVFSNMLTFMSLQDLQYCYLNLNQYCKGQFGADNDLAQATSELRQWVINNFEGSLNETLSKWERMKYFTALKNDEKMVSLQKIQQEIQKAEEQILEDSEQRDEIIENKESKVAQAAQKNSEMKKIRQNLEFNEKQNIDKVIELSQRAKNSDTHRSGDFGNARDYCSERIDLRLGELSWFSRKIVQNIEILGLIITAGWNFFGGVYTIPTNIAIFAWAIVLQTKTTVFFWVFLFLYSSIILSCKLLLSYLPKHFFINFLFYYHPNDYFYEFIMIFVCAVEIIFLKLGGTSQVAYSQRENIYDAFYRTLLNHASKGQRKQKESEFLDIYTKLKTENKHSFFHRVFSKGRLKPGKDLYPLLAILQVIILLYIFFFYDMMEFQSKNNRKSLGEILTVTQFSKNMIFALFFQALIMVADRIIVSLNLIDALNQKLQNFFISIAFSNQGKYQPPSDIQLQKLNRFDYLLIIKYVFHVLLLIAINFFVYFYIPSGGMQKSIIPQCENTVCGKSYTFLSIFLMLYLIYFVISGLQIKHGFNRNKCRNTLMERYDWVDYYIYMFFTGIPFLWEFKKISDWTITATALPLFHWMKFEDINAKMYQSKCQSQILKIKPLGRGPWYKYLMGPPGFMFILCLVFSPIIMYSSFNPFAVQDNIIAASVKIQLVMDKYIYYNFFETSHTTIISDESFQGYNKKILGLFDRANLYKIEASSYPDQIFMLSEPAVMQLSQHIRKTYQNQNLHQFQLKFMSTVTEKEGGESIIEWGSKVLNHRQLQDLETAIHSTNWTMQIANFYSPLPGQLNNQTIFLTNQNNGQYFKLQTTRIRREGDGNILPRKGLFIFYKSSVKYKVAIGLLTFYLTYVVLINSLFRMYLTGGLENILFQGCQLQKILFICQAVRSARILQNFFQEQYLYFSLVDLMRSPRMIKNIADDFCNLKRQGTKMVKAE